ncbi:reverse transcriptase [Gossypium australe]|uniref:Reverse transcriptase n=1 Tax=Gossypium australe TaxID=47621 RepID=A0A5B6VPD5_9ROSI|nr:reverse transcriptase [Gossypium australe]
MGNLECILAGVKRSISDNMNQILTVEYNANRFQKVLDVCIDESQSTFILGRLIIGNVLLAFEILYSFKQRRMRMKRHMTLKLDMSKAYDRVGFLRDMILRMGFESS